MSKKRNRKRNKLLVKRKRQQENPGERVLKLNNATLQNRAKDQGAIIIDREKFGGQKISALVLEMVKPWLLEAKDDEEIKAAIVIGIIAWNFGVIRVTQGAEAEEKIWSKADTESGEPHKALVEEYIKIKCERYGKYNELISDYELVINSNSSITLNVTTDLSPEQYDAFLSSVGEN